MPLLVVIDTNVAMVASGYHLTAGDPCVLECTQRLGEVMNSGILVLDENGLILKEYSGALGHSGQPGAGESFVRWAHNHQAVTKFVRIVSLTPRGSNEWRKFEEFPDDSRLESFDNDDQKFVAAAVATGDRPSILNAVDSDWEIHREPLENAGVSIESLCPNEIRKSNSR